LGQTAVQINSRRRELTTARGEVLRWQSIVSTLPIPELLRLLPDVPPRIADAASRLQALPVSIVLLALNGRVETPIQRIYCSDREFPAHKVVLNHNSSAYLRALPRHGIQAEVAGHRPLADEELTRQVVQGLTTMGLFASPEQIRATRVIRLAAAYPVPTHGCAQIIQQLRSWLASRSIHTVGRFGEWAYINSDEALHRGLKLGGQLAQAA
jgi:protoporphyrinogen oxidase